MAWRRSWPDDPAEVRWCSAACRRRRLTATDRALEAAVVALVAGRATATPEQVARRVAADGVGRDWQSLHQPAVSAARRLAAAGVVELLAGGTVIDPTTAGTAVVIRAVR